MITFEKAQKAIEAAQHKAKELGIAVSVAVVDESGNLVAFGKMDEAIKISPKFAYAKAYTSGSLGMPTGDMGGYAIDGKPYQGLDSIFAGQLTTIAGGMPVMMGGKLVGGVGVGGSTDVSQDAACAAEAVKALS